MKLAIATAGALLAATTLASAEGASNNAPGQEMQQKGSVKRSPGASGYAPGHEMQNKGSKPGTSGASGYAPGNTTGSATKGDHDRDDARTTTKSK